MNRIATELLMIAREVLSIDFPTQDAYNKYLKEHPAADRSNHRVVEMKRVESDKGEEFKKKIREKNKIIEERLVQRGEKIKDKLVECGLFSKQDVLSAMDKVIADKKLDNNGIYNILDVLDKSKVLNRAGGNFTKLLSGAKSLTRYVGDGYHQINDDLRRGKSNQDADSLKYMMDICPRNGSNVLFRGMLLEKDYLQKIGIKNGSILADDGFMSTSTDGGVATDFSVGDSFLNSDKEGVSVLFEIHGMKGRGINLSGLRSYGSSQREVLLPSGVSIRVTGVQTKKYKSPNQKPWLKKHDGKQIVCVTADLYDSRRKMSGKDDNGNRVLFNDLDEEGVKHQMKRLSEPLKLKKVESGKFKKSSKMASDLMLIASELLPRIKATFEKSDKLDDRTMNSIHMDIQRFVATLRKNEDLECFVTRRDDDKVMEITIGFTDHESMKGIVDGMKTMLKKLGKKSGIDVNVTVKTEEKSLEI